MPANGGDNCPDLNVHSQLPRAGGLCHSILSLWRRQDIWHGVASEQMRLIDMSNTSGRGVIPTLR